MAMIRWTGKGLKILGEILDSDSVENWMKNQGKKSLEDKLKSIPSKWFAGQARAERGLRKDIEESLGGSGAFRAALKATLEKLPTVLLVIANEIVKANVSDLMISDNLQRNYIVACPRGLVTHLYTQHVLACLKDAAGLQEYTGLREVLLTRAAVTSEESYFSSKGGGSPSLGQRGETLDTDEDYPWNIGRRNGHYYVGLTGISRGLGDKPTMKEFRAFCSDNLEQIKVQIGKLTSKEIEGLRNELSRIFELEPKSFA